MGKEEVLDIEDDSDWLSVYFSFTSSIPPSTDDPYRWVTRINGEVVTWGEDDDEILVGKFCYYYVDLDSAYDAGFDPHYVLDTEHETSLFIPLYSSKQLGFSRKLLRTLDLIDYEPLSLNLLIGSRMEILPRFRGRGISRKVKAEIFRLFSGKAYVTALVSFPLQLEARLEHEDLTWDKQMKLRSFEKDPKKAQAKLDAFYFSQGYVRFKDNLMVKHLEYL